MSLRLPVGHVTVLLGPSVGRRRIMNRLDDAGGRCATGHAADVVRLCPRTDEPATERLAALADAAAPILLVDRLTDGLAARERRAVLSELRSVAARGVAVLVDDTDPVAALAVADVALRVDHAGAVTAEESPAESPYLAS